MVGFIMMSYYKLKDRYTIWRFMIDERFQGKGYGKSALTLAAQYLKEKYNVDEIFLSVKPSNTVAEELYSSVGFERTGETEGSEVVMCLKMT